MPPPKPATTLPAPSARHSRDARPRVETLTVGKRCLGTPEGANPGTHGLEVREMPDVAGSLDTEPKAHDWIGLDKGNDLFSGPVGFRRSTLDLVAQHVRAEVTLLIDHATLVALSMNEVILRSYFSTKRICEGHGHRTCDVAYKRAQ